MRRNTWCALHDMLAQREMTLARLSQDRLGRGMMLAQQEGRSTRGFLWLYTGLHPVVGPTKRCVAK